VTSTGAGSAATSSGQSAQPQPTATSPGSKPTSGGSSTSSSGSSPKGALIGGIAGGVSAVALIGIGLTIWLCRQKRHQPAPLASSFSAGGSPDPKKGLELHQYTKMSTPPLKHQPDGIHKAPAPTYISELGPTGQPAPNSYTKLSSPSQYSKVSTPSQHAVSPIYEPAGLVRPNVPEMPGQVYVPEMQGQGRPNVSEMPGVVTSYYGQQYGQRQHPGYPNQVYEMGQQQQNLLPHAISNNNGMGYTSGPIYEM
jgi:hypothetical protein